MATNPTTAVATAAPQSVALSTLSGILDKYKGQIAMALPKHLTPERMIRVALTAVSQNPKLQQCNPMTICGAIVQASIMGLEPNSILGDAYLVPFWNKKANGGKGGYEAQLITGYQGKLKLVRNTDQLVTISHDVVREKDEFEYENGIEPFLRHRKAPGGPTARGRITHFWAGALLKNGGKQISVLSIEEVEEHRDNYATSRSKDGKIFGPWVDNFEQMGLKTAIHQLTKLLPKSTSAQMAWGMDERADAGVAQRYSIDVPPELHQTGDDDAPGAAPEQGGEIRMPTRKTDAGGEGK